MKIKEKSTQKMPKNAKTATVGKVKVAIIKKVAKEEKAEITTDIEALKALSAKRSAATAKYNEYLKKYNVEHDGGRTVIKEIIELYKKGHTKQEIIALGYNKHTVYGQIRLFVKGKRTEKTIVAQYLPKVKPGSKEHDIEDESEEGEE